MAIQLCQTLPEPLNYVLFCDNFFTSTKLFKALRSIGIAAYGTAKKVSGFPSELLALRDVATKAKHWGLRTSTTVDDEVLCLGWVDNNTVQLMTTFHDPRELDRSYYLHPLIRHGVIG